MTRAGGPRSHQPRQLDPSKPKLIVVEGPDDEQIIASLLSWMDLDDIQVVNCSGKELVRRDLLAWSSAGALDHLSSLVVLRDADADPNASLDSVRDSLKAAGLPVPSKEFEFVGDAPRTAVALVGVRQQDDGHPIAGRMEELFLLCMIAEEPHVSILACADAGLKCSSGVAGACHDSVKSRVSAFIALSPDLTGKPFGTTGPKGLWNWSHPALRPYLDLLRSM